MEITKEQLREFNKSIHKLWDLYFEVLHSKGSDLESNEESKENKKEYEKFL